jgi:serine/threonine protein kinase
MREIQTPIVANRYRLIQHLRRGGMSEVYLASDEQTGRQVALKLVSMHDDDCFQRLKREVRTLRQLTHEHILPILDYGETGELAYLVMPYMTHGNLRERFSRGPCTQEEAGRILTQVASALQVAHEHGILHRDIKASNILLDAEDNVYLADFGLAKLQAEASGITQTGCLIGTPEYMAPELVNEPESIASDIYALGILLYQMLTAKLPFTGATPIAICCKHVEEMPPLPSMHNPTITFEMESVILRALDKHPQRRFDSASSMAQAYQSVLSDERPFVTPPLLAALPATMTLRKLAERPTLSAVISRGARNLNAIPLPVFNKNALSLAALLFFALTISFGFMLGHAGTHPKSPTTLSAAAVGRIFQPVLPPTKPPAHAPAAAPNASSTRWIIPTGTAAQHNNVLHHPQPYGKPPKHHKHGNGDGGNGDGGNGGDN